MCGIYGYLGEYPASDEILRWLRRLEYRGYDSAGLSVARDSGDIATVKRVGRIQELKNAVDAIGLSDGRVGIGHTRWATHGGVSEQNCHPHISYDGRYHLAHNGIIENMSELSAKLSAQGISCQGSTDTEVATNLYATIASDDPISSLRLFTSKIEGAYALVFLDRDHPDRLFGAKKWSPLVLGFAEHGVYCSSDRRSLEGICDEYVSLEDGDIFVVRSRDDYTIVNGGVQIVRDREELSGEEIATELGEFSHFMMKEIHEQPQVVENVFAGRVNFETAEIASPTLKALAKRDISRIVIIASGTSYHAGLVGKHYIEHLSGIETDVVVSAEFKYSWHRIHADRVYVFISQSGETADTLECMKLVKAKGGYAFGVVNVPGSSIARLSDAGLYTHAGVEIGVASTKAFTGQILTLLLMALALGNARTLPHAEYAYLLFEMRKLPDLIARMLARSDAIRTVAEKYASYQNFFFLGRALELPMAQEGALKLKETTYHHAEAYSSWELKHGSLALIDANFPTIILNADGPLHAKNQSSTQEIHARSGPVIGVISDRADAALYDDVLRFPETVYELVPFVQVVLLQLFAYHMTVVLGNDVDKPRNLAKSVTVE